MVNRTKIDSKKLTEEVGAYSHAIKANGLVFTSGQTGTDPCSGEIGGNIESQTLQALKNLESVLEDANVTLDAVLKVTVYLSDIKFFHKMNEVYATFFTKPFPARSTVAVKDLVSGALVEIEAIGVSSD